MPHQGDRLIKPFTWTTTRATFCLSTSGDKRLIARPYTTAQFYSGHSPDDGGEMWPIFFWSLQTLQMLIKYSERNLPEMSVKILPDHK